MSGITVRLLVVFTLVVLNEVYSQQDGGNHVCVLRKRSYTAKEEYKTVCGWGWGAVKCSKVRYLLKYESVHVPQCCPMWTTNTRGSKDCNVALCQGQSPGECLNGGTCVKPGECACLDGYSPPRCEDTDECAENTDGCDQKCSNTKGSFSCSCEEGYELDSDMKTCTPLCNGQNPGECLNGGTCVKPGECACLDGYSPPSCDDTDECAKKTDDCDQKCTNTKGGFSCSCEEGYDLDSDMKTCTPLCFGEEPGECKNDGVCVEPGKCMCKDGYRTSQCDDFDECAAGEDPCEENCFNTDGSYECSCEGSYKLDSDGRSCKAVCGANLKPGECLNGGTCVKPGTCKCPVGFQDELCADTNECDKDNGGCSHICVNEEGSYHCECREGYTLEDDRNCEDIDECEFKYCPERCENTPGSYRCYCYDGYAYNSDDSCVAVCGPDLNPGECLNGGICLSPGVCECPKGFQAELCADTNECEASNGRCSHICVNEKGSYRCDCPTGYALEDDRKCGDVDECEGDNGCDKYCVNMYGSYTCQCPSGYTLGLDKTCQDIDECKENKCEQHCKNTPGSYECSCDEKFTPTPDGHGCKEVKLCSAKDDPSTGCAPLCTGRFPCLCPEGTHLHSNKKNCIDPCVVVPCEHEGTCIANWDEGYRCDCFAAGYTGAHCEKGVIALPSLFKARVGERSANIPIIAKPKQELVFTMSTKDKNVKIYPNPVILTGPAPFSVLFSKRGQYDLTFNVSGQSADVFDDTVTMNVEADDVFSRLNLYKSALPSGCFWYLLKFDNNELWFSSTSHWYRLNTAPVVYTTGVVMLVFAKIKLPISSEGVEIKAGLKIVLGEVKSTEEDGTQVENDKDVSCEVLFLSQRDMNEFRRARSIFWSLFNSLHEILPYWMHLSPSGSIKEEAIPFKPQILSGEEVQMQSVCTGAPTSDNILYLVFRFQDPFSMRILEEQFHFPEGDCCIIVDMLRSVGPTVTFMFTEEAAGQFMHMDMFESVMKKSFITLFYTGFSISIPGEIELGAYADDINVWNSANIFEYPISKKATVWSTMVVKKEFALTYRTFDFKLEATLESFLSDIDPHSLFTHLFVDPRDVLLRVVKLRVDIGIKIFGKHHSFKLFTPEKEQRAVIAMGGENRTYCGSTANPPGIFGRVALETKLLKGTPIVEDLILGSQEEVFFFKTFPQGSDKTQVSHEWANKTKTKVNDQRETVDIMKTSIAKIDTSRIQSEEKKKYIEVLRDSLTNLSDLLRTVKVSHTGTSSLGFSDFTKSETEYVARIHATYFELKDYLSVQLDSSNDELMSEFDTQIPNLRHHSALIVFQLYYATIPFFPNSGTVGFKGNFGLTILGMQFGIEGEFVSTDENLFYCKTRYSDFYEHLNGETAMRILGVALWQVPTPSTLAWGPLFWKALSPMKGVGFEIAFSQESFKFVARITVNWNIMGLDMSGDLFVTTRGVFASVQANIWDIFRARLTVGVEYSLNPKDWGVWIRGDFLPGGDDSFEGSLWEAVRKAIKQFGESATTRMKMAENGLDIAQRKLSDAQKKIEVAKQNLLSKENLFDEAIANLEKKKQALEAAKARYRNKQQEIDQLHQKLNKICEIQTCSIKCLAGFKRMKWTKCAIKISSIRCALRNAWCNLRRGIIYVAMKTAKAFLHIPIIALDLAKGFVSAAQVIVDKSRWLLKVAAGAYDAGKLFLKGVEWTAGVSKKALAWLRVSLNSALTLLDAFIKNTLQKFLDIKTCGFKNTLSVSVGWEIEIYCEVNFMSRGWKKHHFVINFRNIFGSLWTVAKLFFTKVGMSLSLGKRKRREIEYEALSSFHTIYRRQANGQENSTTSERWTFNSNTFWDDQCEHYKPSINFIKNSLASFINISTAVRDSLREADTVIPEDIDIQTEMNLAEPEEDTGSGEVYEEFNLTKEEVDKAMESINLEDDEVFREINKTFTEIKASNSDGIQSLKEYDVVAAWIAEMENTTADTIGQVADCKSFVDCLVYAFGELHSLLDSVDPRLVQKAKSSLPDIEERMYALFDNNTSALETLVDKSEGIMSKIQTLGTDDIFCGSLPVINSGPNATSVLSGETVTISCTAQGVPEPKIRWMKGDNPITETSGNSITLVNVTSKQAGLYTCIAENHMGNSSSVARLEVHYPPKVLSKLPRTIDLIDGESHTFKCNVSSHPEATLAWYSSHSIQPISTKRTLKLHHQLNSTCLLKCTANNSYGTADSDEVLIHARVASPAYPLVHVYLGYLKRSLHNETESLLRGVRVGVEHDENFKSAIEIMIVNASNHLQVSIVGIDSKSETLNITISYRLDNVINCNHEKCKQWYSQMSVEVFNGISKLMKSIDQEPVLFISEGLGVVFNPAVISLSEERSICHNGVQTGEASICATLPELTLEPPSDLRHRMENGASVFEWTKPVYGVFVTRYQLDLHNKEDGTITSLTTQNSEPFIRVEAALQPGDYEARISAYTQLHSSSEANATVHVSFLGSAEAQSDPSTAGVVVGVSVTVGIIAIALIVIGAVMFASKSHKTGSTPSLISTASTSTASVSMSQSASSETSSKVMAAWQPMVAGDQVPRGRPGTTESAQI